jgi:hypothetical protein
MTGVVHFVTVAEKQNFYPMNLFQNEFQKFLRKVNSTFKQNE